MSPAPLPPGLRLYGPAASLLLPFAWRRASRRLAEGGVPEARRRERLGEATLPRPDGPLAWVHGASVGESLSALDLVGSLLALRPGLTVLVTTGTATSARLLAERLPEGAIHQFAPLDAPGPVGRFLAHWRPGFLALVESEVWPATILGAQAAGVPVALVGARLSERSLGRWERWPRGAAALLSRFALVRTQTEGLARRLLALGADAASTAAGPDLKAAAPPPPDRPEAREAVAGRRAWLALSTHPGEEAVALAAHRAVRAVVPDALLILAPRHPERGEALAGLLAEGGWAFARRSRGEAPGPRDAVYLADTLGDAGAWMRAAEVVVLGGGWAPVGGHNPWEPASLGRPVLSGPGVANAAAGFEQLAAAGAAATVEAGALGEAVAELLADADRRERMGAAALREADAARESPEALARELLGLMR